MGPRATAEDLKFMRWLDSKGKQYREKDNKCEKVILRSGWGQARNKFGRIKGLSENKNKNDLDV